MNEILVSQQQAGTLPSLLILNAQTLSSFLCTTTSTTTTTTTTTSPVGNWTKQTFATRSC
ncbi:hypothetical protein E2C01_056010 [Portunus trituberculatus]|uniref:Uncharacterized protein n=1 Tax=Portunus trituberculatus TaxID=210409 RepID=A0A5B7GW93_PORTR|nr:hypothetical protein [Portunus trituberculatus]